MKFLIQRVSQASVHIVDSHTTHSIGEGLLVYIGISTQDLEENRKEKVEKFVRRIGKYDLFSVGSGKKSLGLTDIQGELLIISNFTLYGRNKKGGSIDFCHAAPYAEAEVVYTYLKEQLTQANIHFEEGEFGALMEISSTNTGPVNVVLEW